MMRTNDRRQIRRDQDRSYRSAQQAVRSLAATPRPLPRLAFGEVVLARVGFAEGTGEKLRPVVVVEDDGRSLVARRVSSALSCRRFRFYIDLTCLDAAGLARPSYVDLRDAIGLARNDVVQRRGHLAVQDVVRVATAEIAWSNQVEASRSAIGA